MLSINTNLSSLIAQNSMSSATKSLNLAIERMTTGYKINHSKDNAANYSISTNMQTQIQSYDVAADNVAMGMDLVTTASDIISNMQDKASRLQALCTQARNGTYGTQSMQAINSEAGAIMAEINRLYSTAEYNGISLFNNKAYEIADHLPKAGTSGFIDETGLIATASADGEYGNFIADPKTYTDEEVAAMTRVKDVNTFTNGQKYSIYSKEELQKLADYVNSGKNTTGVEFVLGADIDLSTISNWTPIGDYSTNTNYQFKGTFDGNGHAIKNLTIDNETKDYQGLFGYTATDSTIKNVALEGVNVKGKECTGGLLGSSSSTITNSYATGDVSGTGNSVGGLVGYSEYDSTITNSYATGNVSGTDYVGGLVGYSGSTITNSYATGDVSGTYYVGGLLGSSSSIITNSYATGAVSGTSRVGGLVGYPVSTITNSYATGNVSGTNNIGGLVGDADAGSSIENSFATGDVRGVDCVGGLIGWSYEGDDSHVELLNSYATGDVVGEKYIGGLVGYVDTYSDPYDTFLISDCASYSQVISGEEATGSIIGAWVGDEENGYYTPGIIEIENCSTTSELSGIGGYYTYDEDNDVYTLDPDYDLSSYNSAVTQILAKPVQTTLQVGINSDSSCQIAFDTNFSLNIGSLGDLSSDSTLASITDFQKLLSDKATALGAVENRLQSALESIEVNIENLTSSLSTIRDADIAEVSSEYIRQQILQQASATLMATTNQSPSIALQLI